MNVQDLKLLQFFVKKRREKKLWRAMRGAPYSIENPLTNSCKRDKDNDTDSNYRES